MNGQVIRVLVPMALCGLLCLSALADDPSPESDIEGYLQAKMAEINGQLAAISENVQVAAVEFYTPEPQVGQIVYANDRALQMGSHWVPFDPGRHAGQHISWLSDQTEGAANGLTLVDTQAALTRAMDTWADVDCAAIPLVKIPDYATDWGYVQFFVGFGGTPDWLADITQAGWLPGAFFDTIGGPGGSSYILGVTFTFVWVDAAGEPTDFDENGKEDVAFREIYYNNNFSWAIDTDYDVETVVLHETGHGLSLDHFGKIFQTTANGRLHFAPRAVMNAAYTGVQQKLTGTDNGAFCSIWASWPNN